MNWYRLAILQQVNPLPFSGGDVDKYRDTRYLFNVGEYQFEVLFGSWQKGFFTRGYYAFSYPPSINPADPYSKSKPFPASPYQIVKTVTAITLDFINKAHPICIYIHHDSNGRNNTRATLNQMYLREALPEGYDLAMTPEKTLIYNTSYEQKLRSDDRLVPSELWGGWERWKSPKKPASKPITQEQPAAEKQPANNFADVV
jgi:hypothetical protein